MIGRRAGGWLVSVIALVGLVWAGVAAGAAPTIERITVNESSEDVFLTEECGVPVTTTAQGMSSSGPSRVRGRGWPR